MNRHLGISALRWLGVRLAWGPRSFRFLAAPAAEPARGRLATARISSQMAIVLADNLPEALPLTMRCSIVNDAEHFQCMGRFRTFVNDNKKFSPKNHRQRVGTMSGKPSPLHVEKHKRSCKQSVIADDICPMFQPKRSRCANTQ